MQVLGVRRRRTPPYWYAFDPWLPPPHSVCCRTEGVVAGQRGSRYAWWWDDFPLSVENLLEDVWGRIKYQIRSNEAKLD